MDAASLARLTRTYAAMTTNIENADLAREAQNADAARQMLHRAAQEACNYLRDDRAIEGLVSDVQQMAVAAHGPGADPTTLTNPDHFEHFLEAETRLLASAGLDPLAVRQLISKCRAIRFAVIDQEATDEDFRAALIEARNASCDSVTVLAPSATESGLLRRVRRRLVPVSTILGGAVLVGVDASLLATTLGLSTWGTAVSAMVGGGLAQQAWSELRATQ
jgi:hypothetical protein